MQTAYKGGKRVSLTETEAFNGWLDGTHGLPHDAQVPIKFSDGTVRRLTPAEAEKAFQDQGATLSTGEAADTQMTKEYYEQPGQQALAAAEGAVAGGSFGLATAAMSANPFLQKRMQARRGEYPITAYLSEWAGSLPATAVGAGAIGGAARALGHKAIGYGARGLGQGAIARAAKATESLATLHETAPTMAAVVRSSLEGGALSAGTALTEASLGNAELNAEYILSHAGTGMMVGGLASGALLGLGKGLRRGVKAIKDVRVKRAAATTDELATDVSRLSGADGPGLRGMTNHGLTGMVNDVRSGKGLVDTFQSHSKMAAAERSMKALQGGTKKQIALGRLMSEPETAVDAMALGVEPRPIRLAKIMQDDFRKLSGKNLTSHSPEELQKMARVTFNSNESVLEGVVKRVDDEIAKANGAVRVDVDRWGTVMNEQIRRLSGIKGQAGAVRRLMNEVEEVKRLVTSPQEGVGQLESAMKQLRSFDSELAKAPGAHVGELSETTIRKVARDSLLREIGETVGMVDAQVGGSNLRKFYEKYDNNRIMGLMYDVSEGQSGFARAASPEKANWAWTVPFSLRAAGGGVAGGALGGAPGAIAGAVLGMAGTKIIQHAFRNGFQDVLARVAYALGHAGKGADAFSTINKALRMMQPQVADHVAMLTGHGQRPFTQKLGRVAGDLYSGGFVGRAMGAARTQHLTRDRIESAGRAALVKYKTKKDIDSARKRAQATTDMIRTLKRNPDALSRAIDNSVGELTYFVPKTADALKQRLAARVDYLEKIIPQGPPVVSLVPQAAREAEGDMSKVPTSELLRFLDVLDVVESPELVLDRMADGSLTPQMVEAIEATSPVMFEEIKTELENTLLTMDAEPDYATKLQLFTLFGIESDPTLTPEFTMTMQKLHAAGTPKPKRVEPRGQGNFFMTYSKEFATPGQELMK